MKFLVCAAVVMLAGLALLLAMVIRVMDPSLGLSMIAYAAICAAMLLGLTGALRRS